MFAARLPGFGHFRVIGPQIQHAFFQDILQRGQLAIRLIGARGDAFADVLGRDIKVLLNRIRIIAAIVQRVLDVLAGRGRGVEAAIAAHRDFQREFGLVERGGDQIGGVDGDGDGFEPGDLFVKDHLFFLGQAVIEEGGFDLFDFRSDMGGALLPVFIRDHSDAALQFPVERFAVEETLVPVAPEHSIGFGYSEAFG